MLVAFLLTNKSGAEAASTVDLSSSFANGEACSTDKKGTDVRQI